MSKFRPLDSDCLACGGIKTLQAGYWVRGDRKLKTKGYWHVVCRY